MFAVLIVVLAFSANGCKISVGPELNIERGQPITIDGANAQLKCNF